MKNKNIFLIIIVGFISKCLLASLVELNNDEVYYWTYAQKLQWSYFDHPPLLAVVLKVFTFNLLFDNEVMLRLGCIVCGTLSTWIIFLIGKKIKNEQTGIIAALLFSASPYCSLIGGLLIIPDGPQLVFWLWSVFLMISIIQSTQPLPNVNATFLLLGIVIGLCILSKVHGIFLWIGFLGFAAIFRRELFKKRFLYFSLFITTCLLSPIIIWNISNDFITYKYQGNRVSFSGAIQWDSFFREILGEILYNNPISFFLILMTLGAMIKGKHFLDLRTQRLLLAISLPLIFCILIMALFRDTLPHWTGPAYTTAIPLAATYINSWQVNKWKKTISPIVHWALGLTISLSLAAICIINWLPVSIGNTTRQKLGEHDVTLDMNGWREFGARFDSLYRSDFKAGLMTKRSFLLADYWFPAAHIDYYIARKYDYNFLAIGNLTAIHNYAWLNQSRVFLEKGDNAYFITVSNFFNVPSVHLTGQFEKVLYPVTITQYRSGIPVRNFFIYRLQNYKGNIPSNGVQD